MMDFVDLFVRQVVLDDTCIGDPWIEQFDEIPGKKSVWLATYCVVRWEA